MKKILKINQKYAALLKLNEEYIQKKKKQQQLRID